MVAQSTSTTTGDMLQPAKSTKVSIFTTQTRKETSTEKDETWAFSSIRSVLKERGIPKEAQDIILKSWRNSTKRQYSTYISKWIQFCGSEINPFKPSINEVLQYLSNLFHTGLQYRSLGVARSALSSFLRICGDIDITKFEEITRFMKGAFNERPALAKYTTTWDTKTVLNFLQTLDNTNITLLQLSCKLCMLYLLCTAQRCQSLHLIELDDINISNDIIFIHQNHLLKQSRPGYHQETISLKPYKSNKNLCIVNTLKQYLKRTENLRNGKELLISTIKPFKAVSKSTVARWIKLTMSNAGIDKSFGPHSTRAASTSKASLHGIPLQTIIRTAGWTNAKTFEKYYKKPLPDQKSIQDAVMKL
jgi:integrase